MEIYVVKTFEDAKKYLDDNPDFAEALNKYEGKLWDKLNALLKDIATQCN